MDVRLLLCTSSALVVAAALGSGACAEPGAGEDPLASAAQLTAREDARTVRVVDGDTLKVRLADGRRRTVRVLGIDTPETKRPDTPVECGGPQASAAMARLALQGSGYGARGRDLVLVFDPSGDRVDRFGRLLAYVESDGRDLGERMIADGWAAMYAYRDRRFRRRARYERAARAARRTGRGVHGACAGDFHSAR